MSLTAKHLKEFLQNVSDDTIITNEQGEDFIHIICDDTLILSTKKPIGFCHRSGGYVYPSVVGGYSGYSIELDEDLLDFEFTYFKYDKNDKPLNIGDYVDVDATEDNLDFCGSVIEYRDEYVVVVDQENNHFCIEPKNITKVNE
jgi:hypothetical protein